MAERKKDHIEMAFQSQLDASVNDTRFSYEPFLGAHPIQEVSGFRFLGKQMHHPIWISSMTGGTALAKTINQNLARASNEFGLGMGLGSCRLLLEGNEYFDDFDVRPILGDAAPLWANLGIAQIEQLLEKQEEQKVEHLIEKLKADGLIIHVNPMQEYFQPEGDLIKSAPIEIIWQFIERCSVPVVVKEVGQGFGRESMEALLQLPLAGIEFAAFGGTNFAKLELMRADEQEAEIFEPLSKTGHTAEQMVHLLNDIASNNLEVNVPDVIISGGVKSFLDGYYLMNKLNTAAVYGQASAFLKYARGDYEILRRFVQLQIKGLRLAQSYLKVL